VFLKNGRGRHQMGAMPTDLVLVFHEIQQRRFTESFKQKSSSIQKFKITTFSKMALKT